MGLFATVPVEEVTVLDIAAAVEMTPAAVYYHFASKEQILIEGMQRFSDEMLAEVCGHLPAPQDPDGLGKLITHLLGSTARRRVHASVFFVNSIGLNLVVEALRRETRVELIKLLRDAVKTVAGRVSTTEAGVSAVALVSLIETSVALIINQDAAYRGLGAKKFAAEVTALANRIAGLA